MAIQGERGSFHHEAALLLMGKERGSVELVCCETFTELFRALTDGKVDKAVCAIENNLHGSINEVYRLLGRHDVFIARDVRMQIHQNLIACQDVSLEELQAADDVTVSSQAPALAQVELWLDKHIPNATRVETHDTAASVAKVVQQADPHNLAIAGKAAAAEYGGVVVYENIEDDPQNYTRFVLLERTPKSRYPADRASIILTTDHTPGSLLRALRVFEKHASNLTKLDSHPIAGDQQHYSFYIDFEIDDIEHAQRISEELTAQGFRVKQLGMYQHLR